MRALSEEHQRQLDEISTQLMRFEASLRSKEKRIEKTINIKDQVIPATFGVIKFQAQCSLYSAFRDNEHTPNYRGLTKKLKLRYTGDN